MIYPKIIVLNPNMIPLLVFVPFELLFVLLLVLLSGTVVQTAHLDVEVLHVYVYPETE